jgi:hypothetical protein
MRRSSERGQVLLIFAGGLVVLLAIAALVIDLGFTFMMQRQQQNAADPGALAAARYIRTGIGETPEPTRMREAACFYARQNGFFPLAVDNGGCTAANDPGGATLVVNYPPGASAGTFSATDGYVEVVITRQHRSFLAQIIGIPTINVSTQAVAAYSDGESNSSSLVALDTGNNCTAAIVHGTGDITIHPVVSGASGGYVHVNSTCGTGTADGICGSSSSAALDVGGTSTLTAPHTYVAGRCKSNGSGLVGALTEGATPIGDPLLELPPPDPADYTAGRCSPTDPPLTPGAAGCTFSGSGVIHLDPGVYYGGWNIRNTVTIELGTGIYIIAGGGIRLGPGGSITSVQGGLGAPVPVLIFNTDDPSTGTGQDNIDFDATGTLKLRGMDTGPYKGILLWNDGNGSNSDAQIDLQGQSSLDISGTIYSPKGHVDMEGGSGVGNRASVQIISWTWRIGGNADLDMPYDPSLLYQFKGKGLVR